MNQPIQKLLKFVNKHLRLLWLIGYLLLLILALCFNTQFSRELSYQELREASTKISNNLDRFFEDLFQEIYSMPVYGKTVDCKSELYPLLEHITLNNPNISGMIVRDKKQKIICSTLPMVDGEAGQYVTSRTILGPFKLKLFDQPVYIVKQRIGNLYIEMAVLASVISKQMQTTFEISNSIALFDSVEGKIILQIVHNPQQYNWMIGANLQESKINNFEGIFSIEKLQSINGVSVIVFENSNTINKRLWYSQIIITFILFLFTSGLYYVLKNILINRYSLNGLMKIALKNREFYPVYQPLYDCKLKKYCGVEVLLRWKDEDDHVIMPDAFISEAELTGLILPITLQIIEIAFKESQHLLIKYPYFHLSINLSALHFKASDFLTRFKQLMKQYSISPQQIILEITERELLDKNDSVFLVKMQELRKEHFSLAVDDYGTGHASISYLQHFPFNYLKIDKLFVQAIGTKAITESLNEAIIQMANSLKLTIIAEGVETKEQADFLAERQVQLLQGWFYSKALTIKELTKLLEGETV